MLGRAVHHSAAHLSARKAQEILDDGEVHDMPLTRKQEKYMRAMAHGMKPKKGMR